MASQTLISFTNRIKAATLTASSSASGYPVTNLQMPERPGLPWRTTTVGVDAYVVMDHGAPITFQRVIMLGANFTTFYLQENAVDSGWGTAAYYSGFQTLALDPDQRLYRRAWAKVSGASFTLRFTRLVIPTQATTDGAPGFSLGGIWLGDFTATPRGFSPGYTREVVVPRIVQQAQLARWTRQYEAGDPFARHTWRRQAEKNPVTPGVGDEWASWITLDRQLDAAGGLVCYLVGNWGTSAAWCVNVLHESHAWQDDGLTVARDDYRVEEALAG